jgi:hypothetical protein
MKRIATSLALAGIIAFPAIAQHNHGAQSPPAQQAPTPPTSQGTPNRQMHGNMPTGMKEKMQGRHGQAAAPSDAAS